ncbi:unnamed protein product [Parnassius apollo]|uniref:(apollo) hypothetical protein n=1 Tax=Parnassius apollo TaxID=110799 RepID=A0A8S3WCK2_PARAO|nr:unnamed protein product [Parnassius apollo]
MFSIAGPSSTSTSEINNGEQITEPETTVSVTHQSTPASEEEIIASANENSSIQFNYSNQPEKMLMEPGINQVIIDHLKKKVEQLTEKEKYCALLFDEMTLECNVDYDPVAGLIDGFQDLGEYGGRSRDFADHALVFMLQSIYENIEEPIAYYFTSGIISSEHLVNLINVIIKTVHAIGFQVITTVCDHSVRNVGALNLLKKRSGLPPDQNYFLLNQEKIYIVFDVPHLFKSIRNNFLKAGVMMLSNKRAQWSHLVKVEERNRIKRLGYTKITKMHIAPNNKAKLRVEIAAQILSNTAANILKMMSEDFEKEVGNALLQTAEVIEELDQLFDCTNGPGENDVNKDIRTNVHRNSTHHQLWSKYKELLNTVVFSELDHEVKLKFRCINSYIITLKSLECIWEYVASKGCDHLNLRRLNQDALENLFRMIRQHNPTEKNQTCHKFKKALKSIIMTRLGIPFSEEPDEMDELLSDFEDYISAFL